MPTEIQSESGAKMPKSTRVSIIVNNYNYARFLPAAIDSALAQTYPNCEIIVVDDGSTDNSRQIIFAYGSRVKVVLKENAGQSSALNHGFQAATGDLICFLDSDDLLFPEAIETAAAYFAEGVAKVHFPLEVIESEGRRTGLLMPRSPLSEGSLLEDYLRTGRYVTAPTSGNLFGRKFLEQIFPIPEKEWAQTADGYINTCAPFFGYIKAACKPLAFYRIHGKSMSAVAHGGSIDIGQMEKLMTHAMLEKKLLEKLAEDRGRIVCPNLVVNHWMHLKLRLALYKLRNERIALLASASIAMIKSLAHAKELSWLRKIQAMSWTIGVAILPARGAQTLIRFAFDHAPKPGLLRAMRRA